MKGANNTYFGNIRDGIKTSLKGLSLTWKHLMEARQSRKPIFVDNPNYFQQQTGIVTLQYPHQHLPLPDNGRYQLHNEMDDCIVCDKCAKVCPVDCIDIEPIKATGVAGYASDGSAIRLFAAKFDIDMAKCMFCGLCTTVCPTECLTMTSEYDFSTFDITNHNFEFGNLTPKQAQEKRELYEQFVIEKEKMKLIITEQKTGNSEIIEIKPKPAFKPNFKPKTVNNQDNVEEENLEDKIGEGIVVEETQKPKPVFKPSFKPKVIENKENLEDKLGEEIIPETPKPKPVFKPSFKPKTAENQEVVENVVEVIPETPKPKPVFKPSFKPKPAENQEVVENVVEVIPETPKLKPVFKPSFKPKPKAEDNNNSTNQ